MRTITKTVEVDADVDVEIDDDDILDYLLENPDEARQFLPAAIGVGTTSPANDDDPILNLIEGFGAHRVLTTAAGSLWRCRAWFGSEVVEATHARRSTAAALVLAKVTER